MWITNRILAFRDCCLPSKTHSKKPANRVKILPQWRPCHSNSLNENSGPPKTRWNVLELIGGSLIFQRAFCRAINYFGKKLYPRCFIVKIFCTFFCETARNSEMWAIWAWYRISAVTNMRHYILRYFYVFHCPISTLLPRPTALSLPFLTQFSPFCFLF